MCLGPGELDKNSRTRWALETCADVAGESVTNTYHYGKYYTPGSGIHLLGRIFTTSQLTKLLPVP
jgi:hypothetical protein